MTSLDIRKKSTNSPRPSLVKRGVRREFHPRRYWPWAGGVAALVLIAVLGLAVLPQAEVVLVARAEPVTRDLEIRVTTTAPARDSAELAIPGTLVEKEVSGSAMAPATGTKNIGTKASGFVYIYNFSKTTLILKKDTTTLTANGRKYFFAQDVGNIRPTALLGLTEQEVDPSSLIAPVPVVAENPGGAYNLPTKARIEIQNEVFGARPGTLYATVAEDGLRGGSDKEVKVITEADIQNGYKSLIDQLVKQENVPAEASDITILEQSTKGKAGTEAGEFEVSVKVKIRALTYKQSDVEDVITARLTRLLPQNKVLLTGASSRLQTQFSGVDLDAGTGTLKSHFEGQVVYRLDESEIKMKIRGKTATEIKELLLSRPEIESVEVKFYPFWVKKAPKYAKKIDLTVR